LWRQYVDWLEGLLHGDLGNDLISHAPLSHLLSQRLPVTLELTVLSMLLAIVIGVPLGAWAAVGGRRVRSLTDGLVVLGVSIPDFWLGIMLVLLFAATLGWLPPSGYVPFSEDPVGNLRYMLLPVATLAGAEAAYILRTTRGAMEAVLHRPSMTYLRAKGIGPFRVVAGHGLRNAAPTIVTVIGIQFGVLLGGAIVVESLFGLPGVGRMIVTSINQRNYPAVQVGVLAVAVLFILVSLLVDLVVAWLDPRVADGVGS
jgi:peptide/nickel transport system permease protein